MMGFGSNGHGEPSAPFPTLSFTPQSLSNQNLNPLGNYAETRVIDTYTFAIRPPQQNWSYMQPPPATNSHHSHAHNMHPPLPATNLHHPHAPNMHPPPPLPPNLQHSHAPILHHAVPSSYTNLNLGAGHLISGSHFSQYSPAAVQGPSRLMLSTPGHDPSERSLQYDYSKSTLMSGFWSRIMDEEQRRRENLDRNLHLNENDGFCKSLLNQDYGVTAIQHHLSGIEPLNESNYAKWKSQIDIVLGHLEYDVALLEPKPNEPDDTASESVKEKYQKWTKADRMCIMIIQSSISETIRAGIPDTNSGKELMDNIRTQFLGSTKHLIGMTIAQLRKMKFACDGSVCEYLDKMVHLIHRLKELKMELPDDFLVYMAINSLPKAYQALKDNFYSTEERWSVSDLIARCAQEEARLIQAKPTHTPNLKAKKKEMKKSAKKKIHLDQKSKEHSVNSETPLCFYCRAEGHMKKECIRYKNRSRRSKGLS